MERDEDLREPLEIQEFERKSIELIDPRRILPTHVRPQLRSRKWLVLLLFITTCLTTLAVGASLGDGNPDTTVAPPATRYIELKQALVNGTAYAGPLMLILLAHEMGHYVQSRRCGVPATLPFFIPMPVGPFGTMGAVIIQGAGVADRKSLFDIAITGPLAGLVLALPFAYFGLQDAGIAQPDPNSHGMIFGDPLILQWMTNAVLRPLAKGEEVILNPMLFAGWVGVFITALNLIPIGQLDGGHILYALIGQRAHNVALGLLLFAVGFMIYKQDPAYGLMVILLFMMGPRHPPTANDRVRLGTGRIILGWLTLAFIIIGFTPTPLKIVAPKNAKPPTQRTGPPIAEFKFKILRKKPKTNSESQFSMIKTANSSLLRSEDLHLGFTLVLAIQRFGFQHKSIVH